MTSLKRISTLILFSGLLISGAAGAPAAAAEEAPATCAPRRLINAEGRGEARVAPDAFRVTVGAEAQHRTLEEARNDVNARMQKILQALKALEIRGIKLQTETLRVDPVTDEDRTPPEITGYNAQNLISVRVAGATPTELSAYASRIVDAAIQSGANNVGDFEFFLENNAEARKQALTAAVADAERNARSIAETSGVRIVELQSVDQHYFSEPRGDSYGAKMFAMAATAGPTPVEAGEIVISASVDASFEIAK